MYLCLSLCAFPPIMRLELSILSLLCNSRISLQKVCSLSLRHRHFPYWIAPSSIKTWFNFSHLKNRSQQTKNLLESTSILRKNTWFQALHFYKTPWKHFLYSLSTLLYSLFFLFFFEKPLQVSNTPSVLKPVINSHTLYCWIHWQHLQG